MKVATARELAICTLLRKVLPLRLPTNVADAASIRTDASSVSHLFAPLAKPVTGVDRKGANLYNIGGNRVGEGLPTLLIL